MATTLPQSRHLFGPHSISEPVQRTDFLCPWRETTLVGIQCSRSRGRLLKGTAEAGPHAPSFLEPTTGAVTLLYATTVAYSTRENTSTQCANGHAKCSHAAANQGPRRGGAARTGGNLKASVGEHRPAGLADLEYPRAVLSNRIVTHLHLSGPARHCTIPPFERGPPGARVLAYRESLGRSPSLQNTLCTPPRVGSACFPDDLRAARRSHGSGAALLVCAAARGFTCGMKSHISNTVAIFYMW